MVDSGSGGVTGEWPDQYQGLMGWEKRVNARFFRRFYDEGIRAYTGVPHITRDRALYESWRGAVVGWMCLMFLPFAILAAVGRGLHGTAGIVLSAVGYVGIAGCGAMGFVRYAQSLRRNPRWRRYNAFPYKGDWTDHGDVPNGT